MPRSFLLWLLLLVASLTRAQQQQSIFDDAGRTLYSREMYGGVLLHGDGWGAHFMYGRYRTAADREMYGIEIVGMKHPKEIKSFNPYYEDSRGYFYGKLNSMLIVRPTFGRKHRITEKIRKSGVELNYVWSIGPSLGLLKPVYLQIGEPEIPPYDVIAVERYDPTKHFANNIYGRASWFKGLDEIKLYPGAFGRVALNFEYAGENTGVKSLEVGATIDAYAEKVPIMAELEGLNVENKQFFLEFYLALQFGGKTIR
ncbi:MAG TPA: hypothetical protein VHL57_02795 [Flavobacteriales bacterium]|jgi:hypothetical protein|nr:hypothetical protein [Flavobacteriales bacterium]